MSFVLVPVHLLVLLHVPVRAFTLDNQGVSPAYTPHPEPTEARHEKSARRLVLAWDDGHESVYPLDYLRSWCPCAGCQGHEPVARYLDLHGQELAHIEGVGNYALGLTWADGHSTGIYSFRLLRGICPCDDCGGEKR